MSAWVKASGPLPPYHQIVSKGGGGCAVQSYGLAISASGGLWWNLLLKGPDGEQLQALTPAEAVAPEALWDDRWHAIAGTFDGTTADLWIDGSKVASVPTPAADAKIDYSFPERRLAVGRSTPRTSTRSSAAATRGASSSRARSTRWASTTAP